MNRSRIRNSKTAEKLKDAIGHIEYTVSNFGDVSDIAWKFLVGQAILDKAKELEISINMEARIDPPKGESSIYIGEAHIDITSINGGDDSPEIQPNSELET